MKRLIKAILKTILFIFLILVANFILDLIGGIASWILPTLLVLAIIALIIEYYYEDKSREEK